MATASGLAAQWGWKGETVFGTPVTVDRFLPLRSESITDDYQRSMADDIIAGQQTMLQEQVRASNQSHSGSVGLYMYNRNIAELFEACIGSVSTSGAGPYTHDVTPADPTKSLTLQVGRPDNGGTVNPWTYEGVMVQRLGVQVTQGEFVTMDMDIIAENVLTATGLASASYPTGLTRYHSSDLAVTIAAGSICARSFEIEFANAFDDGRYCVGTNQIKQPVRNDYLAVSGSIEMEWTDLTQHDYVSGLTFAEIVATFTNGADTVTMTLDAEFDSWGAPVPGRGVVYQTVNFTAMGAATDADSITVSIVNGDATA